jgi:beta-N-acetylhexosaminidase
MKDINELSLEEKLGQLIFIGFKGYKLTDEIREMIKTYKFGNFILFLRNFKNLEQFEKLTRDIHEEVLKSIGVMPFIAIDQEGGNVVRIMHKSTYYPGPMTLSATNLSNVKEISHLMGKHLISLGVNMNFAPLLDININPKNPVIGIRSFSDNIEMVSKFGIEEIKGMQEEGIIATAKHFPGHGDTEIDSHLGLAVLPFDKNRLYNIELKPFKEAIDKGVDNIMSAHIIFKQIDKENPATISKDIIKGILRDELNYKGLITSDCMEMKAISKTITTPIGVAKAIKAGVDLVLVYHTKQLQIDSLKQIKKYLEDNLITIDDIDEKINRILSYKKKVYSAMKKKFYNYKNDENKENLKIFEDENIEKKLQNIVDSSLTHVNGKKLEMKGKVLLYWCKQFAVNKAEDALNNDMLGELLSKEIPTITSLSYTSDNYSKELVDKALAYDTVIFISFNAFTEEPQAKMINELNSKCSNFYVISIRNPYDYLVLDKNINFYTMYESTPNSMRTIIKFLKGEIDAKGKLPITLAHI